LYPEPNSAAKPRRNSTKSKLAQDDGSSPESGLNDVVEDLEEESNANSEPGYSESSHSSPIERRPSNTPSLTHGSTATTEHSPILEVVPNPSVIYCTSKLSRARSMSNRKYSELPEDVRFYLHYARHTLTPHHWTFMQDESKFLSTSLIEAGLRFEPLLYAVVGFAAYHHTLSETDGQLQDFLKYYTVSVSLLRQSLKKCQKHTVATILTILQLATIEVSLHPQGVYSF
jgi:hypothetical protein